VKFNFLKAKKFWRHPSQIYNFSKKKDFPPPELTITDNEANRHQWVMKELATLSEGSTLLDAGAGEQRYKQYCSRLKYISQDFAEYTGAENNNGLHFQQWDTSKIDIVSDITNIPLENAAVDHILCTEVLEHIPDPIAALKEFGRLIKQGGTILLTAPFASLTHFAPYHYASGFNRYFYEYHLPKVGFQIEKIDVNGNYFDVCAQELRRAAILAKEYSNVHCNSKMKAYIKKITDFLTEASTNDTGKASSLAAYGLHVRAKRI
jgi:ubiquinone/menaquinone biosynthesis C-methylase UbiE